VRPPVLAVGRNQFITKSRMGLTTISKYRQVAAAETLQTVPLFHYSWFR